MQENHEGGIPDYLPERAVLRLQLPASIPPSYIVAAKEEGVTILSALSMMPSSPAWLGISGIIVAIIAMSKSFLGTYFGVIEGATEIVKSSLNQVGEKEPRL
jgi:amino acid permease